MQKENTEQSSNRDSTDKSLKNERAKIDDYLESKGDELDQNINNPLFNKRSDADDILSKSRSENDDIINRNPKEIRRVLTNERKTSDDAKVEARNFEDHLIDKKINENNSQINAFLDVERKDTDTKLLDERNDHDSITSKHAVSYDKVNQDLSVRDQYLATVSHDLKNPLSAIILSTSAIKRSYHKGKVDEESLFKFFEIVERNANIMQRLVNDLLDVEQMVNGAIILNLKECNVGDLIKDASLCFRPALLDLNLSLELQPIDETIHAVLDYDRIFQVLSNVIGNAIKFSPPNGVIKMGFNKTDDHICIFVKDEGPGIPDHEKSLIFERFTQLNSNDSRGKGLGLFISKWIIESHNGEIYVDSNEVKGSAFIIKLPILTSLS